MVGLSWPLWTGGSAIPRVPFLPGWPGAIPGAAWGLPGALVASLILAAAGVRPRITLGFGLLLIVGLVGGDQSRFQPWIYQQGLVGLALAACRPALALRLGRWYAISIYAYSALSKLDASFLAEPGRTFLDAALARFGTSSVGWPAWARAGAILAMPLGELAVAAALVGPRSRPYGLAGLAALHASLLAILGPWGLGHSPNVLIWNGAMMLEGWFLFGARPVPAPEAPVPPPTLAERATTLVFLAALAWPLGERFGLCDPWPAHALYASHCERADVFLHEDDLGSFGPSIERHAGPPGPTPWRRLDLTAWSRMERGTPIYPGARVAAGIAAALAARSGPSQPVRLVILGRADPFRGLRTREELVGLRAIRAQLDQFRINARAAHQP